MILQVGGSAFRHRSHSTRFGETLNHPDNQPPRQSTTQTINHPDNQPPRQSTTQTLNHPDNQPPRQSTIVFRPSENRLAVLALRAFCGRYPTREILLNGLVTRVGNHQGRNSPKRHDKSRKSARNLANSLEMAATQRKFLDGRAQPGRWYLSRFKEKLFFLKKRFFDVLARQITFKSV